MVTSFSRGMGWVVATAMEARSSGATEEVNFMMGRCRSGLSSPMDSRIICVARSA